MLFPITGGTQATVQRYVQGVALSTVTTTATSFVSGTTIPVKVMLNSPAPAGGIAVKMTSSSASALFVNNTTAYTAAIPAGSLYTLVNVHTVKVAKSTPVTILGNQNGVQRSAGFTITP
jgi:uncharacterized membrane protein